MSTVLKVSLVKAGEQAESLGIKTGDIIASCDGRPISCESDLSAAFSNAKNDNKKKLLIVVIRNGEEIDMVATTDNLGIACIEHQPTIDYQPTMTDVENIKTQYGVAVGISTIIAVIGWGLVIGGFISLVALAGISMSDSGPLSSLLESGGAAGRALSFLPYSLGAVAGGFLLIMSAQVTKAVVNTADYTRELLKITGQIHELNIRNRGETT